MRKLIVLSLVKKTEYEKWKKLEASWAKYFDIEHIIDEPANIRKYLDHQVDILFLQDEKAFELSFYDDMRKGNNQFAYVYVTSKPSEKDIKIYKHLADGIVYTGISEDYTIWSTISRLRRYWDTYSKPTTIIYRDIIADFIDGVVKVDKKKINLTQKEMELFKFLINNRNKFVQKDEVFKTVWEVQDTDSTRAFDQMFFKLRKKIGEDYFTIVRNKGIKFG